MMGNFCSCIECVHDCEEPTDEEVRISMLYNNGTISYEEMVICLKAIKDESIKKLKTDSLYGEFRG